MEYGESTDLFTLLVTDVPFVVRAAGSAPDSEPLTALDFGVPSNYTALIAAVGLDATQSFLLEPLNVIRTDIDGVSRVRLVNFVSGASTYSVKGSAFADDFGRDLGFIGIADADVASGASTFEVVDADGNTLKTIEGLEFMPNMHYSVLLVGDANDGSTIDALVIETPRETTRVQFINESATPYDIFIRATDTLLTTLEGGATSEFIDLPTGAYTFLVKALGAGSDSQDLAGVALQLYPGRDLVMRLRGTDALELVVESESLTEMSMMEAEATATPSA